MSRRPDTDTEDTDDMMPTDSRFADGALDFLALGALVHRLDPGVDPVPQGARIARST